jgi:hypothetical protein
LRRDKFQSPQNQKKGESISQLSTPNIRLLDYFTTSGAASAVGATFWHSDFCGHSAHFSAVQAGFTSSTFGHSAFFSHSTHSVFGWQQGSPQAPCFLGCPQQETIATDARAIIANVIIFFIVVKILRLKNLFFEHLLRTNIEKSLRKNKFLSPKSE